MKIGDVVKLKRGTIRFQRPDAKDYRTAVIRRFLSDVEGGVEVDRTLGGCCCWNVADLEPQQPKDPQ